MRKLLLVDDEEMYAETLKEVLSGLQVEIKLAKNVKEAIHLLQTENFHAVISDLRMPGGTGMDLLNTIRSRGSNIPFILLSACLDQVTSKQAFELGVNQVMEKPFQMQHLMTTAEFALQIGCRFEKMRQLNGHFGSVDPRHQF